DQAPRLNRIQATSTRGVRARIRRVAGCATPTGSAGHAGATANLKLTFHLDHSAGAVHSSSSQALSSSDSIISKPPIDWSLNPYLAVELLNEIIPVPVGVSRTDDHHSIAYDPAITADQYRPRS